MSTTLRLPPTEKQTRSLVTESVRGRSRFRDVQAEAVIAAVGQCSGGGWRKADLLRGRGQYVRSLFELLRELKVNGATVAEMEGVNTALYDAGRAIATEGFAHDDASFMEALQAEQSAEGQENLATLEYLAHPTVGTIDALIAAHLLEMERSRRIVALAHVKRAQMLEGK